MKIFAAALLFVAASALPVSAAQNTADDQVKAEAYWDKSVRDMVLFEQTGRLAEGEETARYLLEELAEKHFPARKSFAQCWLASVLTSQKHFEDAEKLYRKAREQATTPSDKQKAHFGLAQLYLTQYKLDDAEKHFKECLSILANLGVADPETNLAIAECKTRLGLIDEWRGRYADAEDRYKEALRILPQDDIASAKIREELAVLYLRQGRYLDAKESLLESMELIVPGVSEQAAEKKLLNSIRSMMDFILPAEADLLSLHCSLLARIELERAAFASAALQAEASLGSRQRARIDGLFEIALQLARMADSAKSDYQRRVAEQRVKLAAFRLSQGRDDDNAKRQIQEALDTFKSLEKEPKSVRRWIADCQRPLADLYLRHENYEEAKNRINEALQIDDEELGYDPEAQCKDHFVRARIYQASGEWKEAMDDLRVAIGKAEEIRNLSSKGGIDRARTIAKFRPLDELLVACQIDADNVVQAWVDSEQVRTRSLLDNLARLDSQKLWANMPANQRATLLQNEADSRQRVLQLQRQLERIAKESAATQTSPEAAKLKEHLKEQLLEANKALERSELAIRKVSVAHGREFIRESDKESLTEIQAWLKRQQGLLLQYFVGKDKSLLFVLSGRKPLAAVDLEVGEPDAKTLELEPGPLTAAKLSQAIQLLGIKERPKNQGRLAAAEQRARLYARSAALGRILMPAKVQEDVVDPTIQQLYIVPDGALTQLPFEILVVEDYAETPQYLLDAGPPVAYGPSATVLLELDKRQSRAPWQAKGLEPVLSVGAPDLPQNDREFADFIDLELANPPQAKREMTWVSNVFKAQGVPVAELEGQLATEAKFRAQAPGRRLIHFACHGLAGEDEKCKLALTPGAPDSGSDDDGLLTLSEICELDLKSCELGILSACETNIAELQAGEGVRAMSRGFLVAGANRVVATDWLVGDEVSASLVAHFCAGIERARRQGGPVNYAGLLQISKRWVRDHPDWEHPYFWGAFVMMGAN